MSNVVLAKLHHHDRYGREPGYVRQHRGGCCCAAFNSPSSTRLCATDGYREACYGQSPVSAEGNTMRDPLGTPRGIPSRDTFVMGVSPVMFEARYPSRGSPRGTRSLWSNTLAKLGVPF